MKGRLDLIVGPMFSGKTTALLTKLSTLSVFKNVCVVNCVLDTRNDGKISTHNVFFKDSTRIVSKTASRLGDVDVSNYDVIGVDEAQFFPDLLDTVTLWLDSMGKHVIVSGLDGSWQRKGIGDILLLVPLCRTIKKKLAICAICAKEGVFGEDAPYSMKIGGDMTTEIEIGGNETYIPVCEYHFKNHEK